MLSMLVTLSLDEILEFHIAMRKQINRAYNWELWGATYLLMGGCSDDSFEYFIGWLMVQGQERFESTLANPDALAEFGDEDAECESFLYVGYQAFEERAGTDAPVDPDLPELSDDTEFDFDDDDVMRKRYPKIWAKVMGE